MLHQAERGEAGIEEESEICDVDSMYVIRANKKRNVTDEEETCVTAISNPNRQSVPLLADSLPALSCQALLPF